VGAVPSLGNRFGFGRMERVSLAIAAAWGVGLLVVALFVPVYQSERVSSSGAVTQGSATLVDVNGWGVLLVTGVPLLVTLVVGGALWHRAARPGAGVFAWTAAGLLVCFNVLAMLSIGVFVIPVTVGVVAACAAHGGRRDRGANRPGLA